MLQLLIASGMHNCAIFTHGFTIFTQDCAISAQGYAMIATHGLGYGLVKSVCDFEHNVLVD